MFCTNCGEEMRDTDKFCAVCGTPAAPRPTKKATVPESPQVVTSKAPEPARVPQSTAEAFSMPVRPARVSAPESPARQERQPERPPESFPTKSRAAETWEPPLTEEEQRQTLIEAEEIASARGMMPIEALPDSFATPPKTVTRPVAATMTCPTCGKLNPETNAFCESCGRKLGAPANAPAETPANPGAGWLYDTAPVAPSAPVPAATPARTPTMSEVPSVAPLAPAKITTSARTTSAADTAPAGLPNSFSYYYDDTAGKAGSRRLLYVLLTVLVLGIVGILYLMLRPSPKRAAAGNVTVRIAPAQAQVAPGNAYDFAATVNGSGETDVNWSVQEGTAGGKLVSRGAQAQGGEVANMAVYVAPSTPGTYHVVAASKADPAKTATAEVLVEPK